MSNDDALSQVAAPGSVGSLIPEADNTPTPTPGIFFQKNSNIIFCC